MKILLTLNKTYRGFQDMGYWYAYQPLKELGHEVLWYDTVNPEIKDYTKVLESFKPDLAFCCFTGDPSVAPYEPWLEIDKETKSGRTKTFNWFCDDTWRFDSFSSRKCKHFTACSTPEPGYLEKYQTIGYKNILLGNWHANSSFYPKIAFNDKDIELCFVGNVTPSRRMYLDNLSAPAINIYGVPAEQLFLAHSRTKIGINFSVNDNDPAHGTQMKQRMFEIPAGGGLLVTEYHKGIEEFYDIDKEIITFETKSELNKKVDFLLKNPDFVRKVANKGHRRYLQEHDSSVRLKQIIDKLGTL